MRTRRKCLVGLFGTALLLASVPASTGSASVGLAGHAAPSPSATQSDGLLKVKPRVASFSPNRDGAQDQASYQFRLRKAASVKVTVLDRLPDRETVVVRGPIRLGELGPGKHRWRWDGARNRGGVVADGYYEVRIVAGRRGPGGRVVSVDHVLAVVDTYISPGVLQLSQDSVHPRATVVDDAIVVTYTEPGLFRVTLEVRDDQGRTTTRRRLSHLDAGVKQTAWFGQRPDGRALPAGRYLLRVTARDKAGNRRVHEQQVHVRVGQLVEEIVSETRAAKGYPIYDTFCRDVPNIGCGQPELTPCDPVDSDRFEHGLSFRDCPGRPGSWETFRGFAPRAQSGRSEFGPGDQYRITATGGPTEPGSADGGYLNGTYTGPGDGSTTTEWIDVELNRPIYYLDFYDPIDWTFVARDENNYDIATFTLEYRHYVPAG